MADSKYSPGPWRKEFRNGCTQILDADGNSLMGDEQFYPWTPKNEADWNLIAAAPELLEALKATRAYLDHRVVPFSDHKCDWCAACIDRMHMMQKTAITRAKGRP